MKMKMNEKKLEVPYPKHIELGFFFFKMFKIFANKFDKQNGRTLYIDACCNSTAVA